MSETMRRSHVLLVTGLGALCFLGFYFFRPSETEGMKIFPVGCLRFARGDMLLVGTGTGPDRGANGRLHLFSSPGFRCVLTESNYSALIRSIAISPRKKLMATGGSRSTWLPSKAWARFRSGEIRLWAVQDRKLRLTRIIHYPGNPVTAVCFGPEGKQILSGDGLGNLCFWDVSTGKRIRRLSAHSHWITHIVVNPVGSRIATCAMREKEVVLWDFSGQRARALVGHQDEVQCVAFLGDNHCVSGGKDGALFHWDIQTGKREGLVTLEEGITALAVHHTQKLVVFGTEQGMLSVYDLKSGKQQSIQGAHRGPIWSVAISGEGKWIASSPLNIYQPGGEVCIWKLPNLSLEKRITRIP